jgi:hypothetical protein
MKVSMGRGVVQSGKEHEREREERESREKGGVESRCNDRKEGRGRGSEGKEA